MRKTIFILVLVIFTIIPGYPASAWPPANDPTTYCYPWQGNRWFCNWWGFTASFGRGPYWYSNDDYIANMPLTFGTDVYHVTVTIEAVYENIGGVWRVKSACRDAAPARYNDNSDWQEDYNTAEPWFDGCDTCLGATNNRLKSLYFCFPTYGSVTVAAVPGTDTPEWVATTMQEWLNNEGRMYLPSANPPSDWSTPWDDTPGSRVVYSWRYQPQNCN